MQTRQDVKPLNTDARNSQVQNIPSVPSIILTSDSGKTSPMFFDDSLLLDETIEKDQTLLQPICHLMVDLKSKVLLLNERENLTNEREIIKNILNKLTESIENKENCNNILEKECQIEQKQAGINKENVTPLSSEPSPMPDDVFYDTVYSITPSTGVSTMVGDENVSVEAPKPSEFEIYCSIDKTCDVAQMSPTKEKLPCDSNESAELSTMGNIEEDSLNVPVALCDRVPLSTIFKKAFLPQNDTALLSLTKMDSLNEPRDDHSQKFGRNEIGDISTETESAPNDIAMKLNERYNHTNQDIKRYVSCIIEKSLKHVQSKMLQSQHLNEKPTDAVQKLVSDIINVSVNELLDTDSKESGSLNQKICDGALKLSKNAISASLHEMETSEAEEIEQLELENKTATYTLHEINNNQEENDIDKDHTCFTETNSSINTVIEKEDKKLIVKNTIGTSILSDDNDKVKSPLLKTSNLSIASQCVISDVIASLHSENEDVSISSNANKISGGEGDGTNYTESVDKLPNVADADSAVMSSGGGDYNIKVYNLLHFTPKKSKHEDEIFSSPKDSFYLPFRSICPGDKLVLDYVKNDNLDRVYFQITDDSIVNDLDQTMSSWEISDDKELIPLRNVEVGMLCLVQNPSDETWHRGRIMSEISPTEVTVLIIDYGVLLPKPVAVSSLCLLPNKLKLFPPLVLSCKVHGLNIKDPEVISKKSEQLKELCFGYSLLGEVVEVEYENYEQIFDVVLKQEGKQDDIAQIMMSD